MPRFTSWDWRVLVRAAIVATLAFALAWLLTAATDEGGIGWSERAGRTLPLVPACSALGVWAALAPAARRGEARALASLGRSHVQIASAALAGAALVASVAAIAVAASRHIDVDGFFPTAVHAQGWRYDGEVFVDDARGLIVGSKGTIARRAETDVPAATADDTTPLHGRAAAALATALYGLALPLLLALSILVRPANEQRFGPHDAWAVVAAATAIAATIVLFQSASSRHVPALLGVVPPVLLLGYAVRRYRVPR